MKLSNKAIASAVAAFFMVVGAATGISNAQQDSWPVAANQKLVTTRTGLQYVDLQPGPGPSPSPGSYVSVHYTGWFLNKNKFDSSVDRGTPFEFQLGAGQVIKGWDEGVASMKVGGKRRLVVPPNLAYGQQGMQGAIPPNSTLVFDVQLIKFSATPTQQQ
jgi:peptidylprolyl isomerase